MQLLGLVLILINIGAIATPIAGVVIIHSNDLSEIIIPPEVEEIITNTLNTEESIQLPQYVSSTYDTSTKTAKATFNFTNPYEFTLTLYTISADLQCTNHDIPLGHAALDDQVQINPEETEELTINFMWTQTAQTHFLNQHANEPNIDIDLENMQLDISGIDIEIPEQVTMILPIMP